MLFNSIDFAIFLPVGFFLYWFVLNRNLRLQNFLIVVASYLFYGWWDWRFLSLIFFSTLLDFAVGLALDKKQGIGARKFLLGSSIIVNLGLLGFFKYYNFFAESFVTAFTFFGQEIKPNTLNIILPVGISFYTFQTMSYAIDVYRRKLKPTRDFISFAAFVSFFPQLVAGPIERATSLLPQFFKKRRLTYAQSVDGMRQILWGLFKKMVIADNAASFVNQIFQDPAAHSGSTLALGAVLFAFQIYGDFSGYSDIAIGTARLFGFELTRNFNYPYFSRDIAEFWRRWHISLTTWFRDYVYIPLGGSRGRKSQTLRNVFVIFLLSGLWHGANWTFVCWGLLHAVFFLPLILRQRNRRYLETVAPNRRLPSFRDLFAMSATFLLVCLAWVFFRAENLPAAFQYIQGIFSPTFFQLPAFVTSKQGGSTLVFIIFMLVVEWNSRTAAHPLANLSAQMPRLARIGYYYFFVIVIFLFSQTGQDFIYFQF